MFPSRSICPSLTESPRKIGLTSRLRVAGSPPAHHASSDDVRWNSWLVELGAWRHARPVRRRLIGLTLGSLPRLIPMFYPMPRANVSDREKPRLPKLSVRRARGARPQQVKRVRQEPAAPDKSPRGVTAAIALQPDSCRGEFSTWQQVGSGGCACARRPEPTRATNSSTSKGDNGPRNPVG